MEQQATLSPHVTENICRVIRAARLHLGMDIAFVSEFLGKDRVLRSVDSAMPDAPLTTGMAIPMTAGYCKHVVSGHLPELIPDTRTVPFTHTIPETSTLPIGAHLSVPIRQRNGRVFGTFCCISHTPQPRLHQRDLDLVRTFADMVASDLAADLEAEAERRDVIDRLHGALAKGDPSIVFQPIIRVDDYSIAGVEALSRFFSQPSQGPDKWFSDAHKAGIGPELELAAARKALVECQSLPSPLAVNVNLSPDTIATANITDVLSVFDPKRIVVEITEHVPIADYGPLQSKLASLRQAGMRVAIDDAGAGYSSMRHVLSLRPDIIKLDVSLTRDIDQDFMRKAMVAAMCEFSRHTGTRIVAEGVENEAEFVVLRQLGVEKVQGYYFGRPKLLNDVLTDVAVNRLATLSIGNAKAVNKSHATTRMRPKPTG